MMVRRARSQYSVHNIWKQGFKPKWKLIKHPGNLLDVQSHGGSAIDNPVHTSLSAEHPWTDILSTPMWGTFSFFVMMMTMAMTFLVYVRMYEDFFAFDSDEDPVVGMLGVIPLYSLLQMSLMATTHFIAKKITTLENHRYQNGFKLSLRRKQVVLNFVGIISPILYIIGKALLGRYLMPNDHASVAFFYLKTLLIGMLYPCWLAELGIDTCPAEVETTVTECVRLTVHVSVVAIVAATRICDAAVINRSLNRLTTFLRCICFSTREDGNWQAQYSHELV
ncbi:uncharacterized protein [Ptychodera flava]|uniref:uncharacterized protein n=1 Tax=Ptychodera flava TaxID=63121 RepID=UPI00396AA72E